ncbi:MAG: alpha/beta hydrolase-fold protein [Butyrivibrio sp.]|nr:alpha/beta hydrolase-fold protein [Butyrivibrio sp.]
MFITLGQYRLTCYLPENKDMLNAVYIHADAQDAEEIFKLTDRNFALIAIDGIDWNRDLTPWRHNKIFAKGEEFAGKADDYLDVLTEKLIPVAEREFALNIDKRYLVGYSLSGLFVVYAIYHTAIFDGIGSVSGSLWYGGFTDYVKCHTFKRNPDKMYFSLGDKEASSARGIMQTVLACTEQLEEKYRNDGIKTVLEMNEGKHFTDVPERIAKGIKWLL